MNRVLALFALAWLAIAPTLVQEGLAQEAQLADPQLE